MHWFSLDHRKKSSNALVDHLDGKAFRKIAHSTSSSKSTVGRHIKETLESLSDSNLVTVEYCDRFCGIIVVDGKYVKVKGYEKKIPLLWGIDYLTHDLPVFILARGESYESWLKYFGWLKRIRYPLQIVICDDNENIRRAAIYMFPNVHIQLCHNHYLENIRKYLKSRTETTYQPFIRDLKKELFSQKLTTAAFQKRAFKLFHRYKEQERAVYWLMKINEDTALLTGASKVVRAPTTTNIIESFNSHLQGRLKTIKGFESFQSAKQWLNAYILRRRVTPFTDCTKKFRNLNKKKSLFLTCKKNAVIPHYFV